MYQSLFEILTELARAWRDGTEKIRAWLVAAAVLLWVAAALFVLSDSGWLIRQIAQPIAAVLGGAGLAIGLSIYARQRSLQQAETERKIEAVERRYEANPTEPKAAWDLARVKLEVYLNRNLNQGMAVFWLTLLVMTVGFVLIGVGVWRVYETPSALAPSILAAVSGILINLIGASFLVVYRSTMEQARGYVSILERINAVGMAVQILESIDPSKSDLKAQATADLSKQLLSLYGTTVKGSVVAANLRRKARSQVGGDA